MSTTHHRLGKIRKGFYNYRGYNLKKRAADWIIVNVDADDGVFDRARTRRILMRRIDRIENNPRRKSP